MMRALLLCSAIVLAAPPVLDAAECDTPGVVWTLEGEWILDTSPVQQVQRFKNLKQADYGLLKAAKPPDNTKAKVVILLNGEWKTGDCSAAGCVPMWRCAKASATTQARPMPAGFWGRLMTAMGGGPEYREALSRSSGWSDSIVAIEPAGAGNRADLAEVFRGGRARQIAISICPTNRNEPCNSRSYAVDWNGQTAFVTADAVTAGTFRVVEGDDESDAWVRFVASGDADRVRAAYTANVAALDTWSLPADAESAPSLQRMRRVILATVTD